MKQRTPQERPISVEFLKLLSAAKEDTTVGTNLGNRREQAGQALRTRSLSAIAI
jgi:hypothetical protein